MEPSHRFIIHSKETLSCTLLSHLVLKGTHQSLLYKRSFKNHTYKKHSISWILTCFKYQECVVHKFFCRFLLSIIVFCQKYDFYCFFSCSHFYIFMCKFLVCCPAFTTFKATYIEQKVGVLFFSSFFDILFLF